MRTILRLSFAIAFLSTLVIVPPPAAAVICVNPVGNPTGCVPCWDGGNNCPCEVNDPVGCGPCDPLNECIPDPCDLFVCDVYLPDDADAYVDDDGSIVVEYRECNMQGWCRTDEFRVPTSVNTLPREPAVVNHGNASFSVTYKQCDRFGGNCQVKTAATTPNRANASVPATYSPAVNETDVYTPGVPEACAPFAIVCVSANPIYVTTVPGAGPVLLLPASGFEAGVTHLGFTTPTVVFTPVGPYTVVDDPISVVVCRDTCPVPTGVTGGPSVEGDASVYVGGYSKEIPIGLP